eukprot:750094-Hanusia_phi.AAC.1
MVAGSLPLGVGLLVSLLLQAATCFSPPPSLLSSSRPLTFTPSPVSRHFHPSPRPCLILPPLSCKMTASEYETLKPMRVQNVKTSEACEIVSPTGRRLLVFLVSSRKPESRLMKTQTHFGDLASWEYARQLLYHMPQLESQGNI